MSLQKWEKWSFWNCGFHKKGGRGGTEPPKNPILIFTIKIVELDLRFRGIIIHFQFLVFFLLSKLNDWVFIRFPTVY